jgi:hypothetical protein
VTFSQTSIYKNWIGENLEYLELKKRSANFDYGYGFFPFDVSYNDSILILTSNKKRNWIYHYKVRRLTPDSLIISPQDSISATFLKGKSTFIFVDKNKLPQKEIKFQNLSFSQGDCGGPCPSFKINIDSVGTVYFQTLKQIDNLNGTYKGQLSPEQLNNFIEVLKASRLEMFPKHLGYALGLPKKTFVIHYNNAVLRSQGYCIPPTAASLEDYLMKIYTEVNLQKTIAQFKFEM